jgi:hypothetical protein
VGSRKSRGIFQEPPPSAPAAAVGLSLPGVLKSVAGEALNRIAYPSLPIQIKVIPFLPDTFAPRVVAKFVDGGTNL